VNKRKLVLLLSAVSVACVLLLLLPAAAPQPVVVRVLLRTNDALGLPCALIAVTNVSGATQRVRCVAEVFEGARWTPAFRQNTLFDVGRSLAPAESLDLRIHVPAESQTWRLNLFCQREPALLSKLLRKLLMKAGFRMERPTVSVTVNMPP